ncbi:MAG: UDP-N-acetylmuramate--L-alanine ligase, partial [Clostridia bacterium]|nr:UDP-N-acetylmuramate--L-alanine ligase [Clostridia bacterium]
VLKAHGVEVTGSDTYESDTLQKVRKLGIKVYDNQSPENIKNPDAVIYSAAIKETNPEIVAAKEKGITLIKRSKLMGMIFEKYKNSIGVSGTHGKTTTTSMITTILLDAKKDPTAIIGGTLLKIGSNCHVGKSDIIVGEACEYVDSFLDLNPKISVVTNVDSDHLDYFKTFENVKKSFSKYISQTSTLVVANGDDESTKQCVKQSNIEKVFFGLSKENDFYASDISYNKRQCASFSIFSGENKIADISLNVPGKHNIYNALAAFCVCFKMGVDPEIIKESLKGFKGAHRRFEILKEKDGITIADDFAHHPTEIKTTLEAASKMGFKRVIAIFQPHTFSRTYMLLDDFAKVLSIADMAIISDILPVRETNTYGVKSTDLTSKIKGSVYLPTFEEISDFILKNAASGDLILTLGGGNVYECANMIASKI